jgi:hypothetical protein
MSTSRKADITPMEGFCVRARWMEKGESTDMVRGKSMPGTQLGVFRNPGIAGGTSARHSARGKQRCSHSVIRSSSSSSPIFMVSFNLSQPGFGCSIPFVYAAVD